MTKREKIERELLFTQFEIRIENLRKEILRAEKELLANVETAVFPIFQQKLISLKLERNKLIKKFDSLK